MRVFLRHNRQLRRATCSVALGLVVMSSAAASFAQDDPLLNRPASETLIKKAEPAEPLPTGESDGLAYSDVLRDTDPPYHDVFSDVTVGGTALARLGPQGAGYFDANFFRNTRLQTPFSRAIRPEDAELKLGIFYLDVTSVSGSIIYSDNVDQTEKDPEHGAVAVLRLNLGAIVQLGDNFRLYARGAVIYLPFRNAIGIGGFINEPLFDFYPLGEAQIAYDLHLSHWEIQVLDNFTIRHRVVGANADFDYFHGETFDESDRAGRYVIRNPEVDQNRRFHRRDLELNPNLIEWVNTAGARASRMLPTETRMEVGAFHQNRGYTRGKNIRASALPRTHDYAYVNLVSERESMRFKPYAGYRVSKYDTYDDWTHLFRVGIRGPVSEYIFFRGDIGYFEYGEHDRIIWRVSLDHEPTPLLRHRVQYAREITDPEQDVEDTLSYRIRYQINADLWAELYSILSHVENLSSAGYDSRELRHGVRFTYRLAQRMTTSLSLAYNDVDYRSSRFSDVTLWTGRLDLRYQYSEDLAAWLTYRHQRRDSDRALDSYDEDTVWLTVVKYF